MTVEMNPPSSRDFAKGGSSRQNGSSRSRSHQKPEDSDRRLSAEVQSLNSWSESLNLSTSSSSESGSRHGSCSSHHGLEQQEVKHKARTGTQAKRSHKQEQQIASGITNKGKSNFGGATMQYECDGLVFPGLSLSNYEYDSGMLMNDPDFTSFNKFHNYGVEESQTWNRIRSQSARTEPKMMIPGGYPTQRLYPDLNSVISQEEPNKNLGSAQPSVETPPLAVNSKDKSALNQQQRPQFFSSPSTHVNQSRSQKTQNHVKPPEKQHHRPFQSLPTSYSTPSEREISYTQFPRYNDNTVEHNPFQGSASVGGRLHKSQPSIQSEPVLKRKPKSSSDLESLRQAFEHRLEPENVKTKVKSVWNNIKYGWTFKSKPTIKYDSPLFMLGKCYHKRKDDGSTEPEDDFLKDFASRIWFTYRTNFYPIPGTKLNTDCGWGCMLRSGQMLIAQCLVTHYLGRDWRLYNEQTETQSTFYREILRWFSDPVESPSDKSPFCLHHLASFGRTYNKDPGEWYGPSSVAYIFRDAFALASQAIPILSQLCIYVAQDCTVYIDDVIKLCTSKPKSESICSASEIERGNHVAGATAAASEGLGNEWLRSVIILVPMRLGGEVMNEIYIPCVKGLLAHDSCMGIIGGKPRHSLYFLGYQDEKLIYLDPHLCRDAVDTSVKNFRIETYHCMTPRKLSVNKMDPSCTVGFYIRNKIEFDKFVYEIQEYVSPPKQKGTYPLFIFSGGSHMESPHHHPQPASDRRVRVTHYHVNENGQRQRAFSRESEDFVML